MATFKKINSKVARQLVDFIDRRNLGKAVVIDGKEYVLDHISHNPSGFFNSRGLSVYFRVGKSIVRISDHWAASPEAFARSRKLNCGHISGKQWVTEAVEKVYCHKYAGRFPFEMLAGICGLSVLNKECDHWRLTTD